MKLAEALQERADLNKKISYLHDRLEHVILVQEGEEPVEDPRALLAQLNECIDRLEYLMVAINRTNAQVTVNGQTLTALIARKDALRMRMEAYKDMVYESCRNTQRARNTEIKVLATIKASELQKTVDDLAKEIRLTDNLLQETNWSVSLIEE